MFSFSSVRRVSARSTAVLVAVSCLSMALLFTGCPTEESESGNLNGTWAFIDQTNPEWNYNIIINTSAKTVVYEGRYEGQIANSPDFTAANGVLIIKFTKYADWGGTPSASHGNVNKFGAMYWTGLTANSVKLVDAYDAKYNHVMKNTLPEAQTAFTADKVSDYVDWSIASPLSKK